MTDRAGIGIEIAPLLDKLSFRRRRSLCNTKPREDRKSDQE
jgi:hypothetical protein